MPLGIKRDHPLEHGAGIMGQEHEPVVRSRRRLGDPPMQGFRMGGDGRRHAEEVEPFGPRGIEFKGVSERHEGRTALLQPYLPSGLAQADPAADGTDEDDIEGTIPRSDRMTARTSTHVVMRMSGRAQWTMRAGLPFAAPKCRLTSPRRSANSLTAASCPRRGGRPAVVNHAGS